jgi:hypothetical protein
MPTADRKQRRDSRVLGRMDDRIVETSAITEQDRRDHTPDFRMSSRHRAFEVFDREPPPLPDGGDPLGRHRCIPIHPGRDRSRRGHHEHRRNPIAASAPTITLPRIPRRWHDREPSTHLDHHSGAPSIIPDIEPDHQPSTGESGMVRRLDVQFGAPSSALDEAGRGLPAPESRCLDRSESLHDSTHHMHDRIRSPAGG